MSTGYRVGTRAYRGGRAVRLLERVAGGAPRVDEAGARLLGVKVLGLRSGNGRSYEPSGLAAAAGLYEGRPVFTNHRANDREPRKVEEKLGWLENIRAGPKGLTGDLCLLRSHPMTARILEAAARRPELFALSHDAIGRERPGSRGTVIEGIASVASVDVVAEGATTRSLWEGLGTWPPAVSYPAAAADDDTEAARVEEIRRLRNVRFGFDPDVAAADRARLLEQLRAVRSPAGGGALPLREQLDVHAAREAEVRRLRSLR
jgi:hypothetical protein